MNWKNLFKAAFASIGGAAASSSLTVLHSHKFSEPLDYQSLSSAALVGALIGLANLFIHPPGITNTATVTVTQTKEA